MVATLPSPRPPNRPLRHFLVASLPLTFVALTLSCTGESAGRQEFMAAYCELVRPCCAEAGLATDGVQCRAILEAYTPRVDYDAAAGGACLDALRASSLDSKFCEGPAADTHACERVFTPRGSVRGTVAPGERCNDHRECVGSSEGPTFCQTQYTATARTRTCQIQIRGKSGDGPCLYTVPELSPAFPYPGLPGVGYIVAYAQSFPSGGEPPSSARAYLCHVADGLTCSSQTGRCTPQASSGAPCSGNWSCVPGAYCDQNTQLCRDRQPMGGGCLPQRWGDSPCLASYCDLASKTCQARVPLGAACLQDDQCESGACVNDRCVRDEWEVANATMVCGER
jgi:hypothetical protein